MGRDVPEPRASCCPFPHSQQRREGSTALLALLCGFSSSSALTRRLWRWDAPRPVSLTRGFKGHTPFIRPVFETASAASCLCHQVRLGLLSGWTMKTWSRFARQKEERTSSALTRRFELRTTTPTASYCGNPSAPCLKAPENDPEPGASCCPLALYPATEAIHNPIRDDAPPKW